MAAALQYPLPTSPVQSQPFFQVGPDGTPSTGSGASKAGGVALSSPPATTNAGSDTLLTFSSQVNRFLVQNTTSVSVYVELDAVATTGSLLLAPGIIWEAPIQVTVIHVYTVAAQPVNTIGGIIVRGWL